MIALNGVTKEYRLGQTVVSALRGIDLHIDGGAFVSLCGPSGSGKSTLLQLIGCLDAPTSGSIQIMGKDVSRLQDNALSRLRRQTLGFIFQTFNLIPVLTAYENVEYPLILCGVKGREKRERVLEILDQVGLGSFAKHKPDELSGGQRQRVAIARALVTRPRIVLADEPTANLDSATGEEIIQLMQKMNVQYKTLFLFSTHDPKIMQYAETLYRIADGRIAA